MSTIRSQSRPPIRISVIGATTARGWGTAAHLSALQALEEFEVTAVATTRLVTARATAEVFGVPLAFADGVELVSHPEVDAVAITVKVPPGVGQCGPSGRGRLVGHERSRHTAHHRMRRSGPAPPG